MDEQHQLNKERTEIIEKRKEEKEKKEEKVNENRQKLLDDIAKLGGKWTNELSIHNFLENCSLKKDKLQAIKSQITYRKEICGQIVAEKDL